MAPRYIKTITVVRPDELWETKTTAAADDISSAPKFEEVKPFEGQTGPSLEPSSTRKTRRAEAASRDADALAGLRLPQEYTKAHAWPTSSASIARSKRPSTSLGLPLSNIHTGPTQPPASNPAKKVYGVVPNRPTRRAETFIGFQTQVQPAATGTPLQNETLYGAAPQDRLPDLPPWFAYWIFGWLIFGFAAAALLYFANYPPSLRWLRRKPSQKHRYEEIKEEDFELEDYDSRHSPTAFSTSADTPTFSTHQRPSPKHLCVDTTAAQTGLGITWSGNTTPDLRKRRSFDDRLGLRSPLPSSPAATAPLPSPRSNAFSPRLHIHDTTYETQHREPDLEDGLLLNKPRPSPALSQHSSRSSSRVGLFEKLGDGFEYATDYLARVMQDQVRDDPEEGLLLPVRSCERERLPFEGGKLKKVC